MVPLSLASQIFHNTFPEKNNSEGGHKMITYETWEEKHVVKYMRFMKLLESYSKTDYKIIIKKIPIRATMRLIP